MSSPAYIAASPMPMNGIEALFDDYDVVAAICFAIIVYFISFTLYFKTGNNDYQSDQSDVGTVEELPAFRERVVRDQQEIVQIEAMVFSYREAKRSENDDDDDDDYECVICLNKFEDAQKCRWMKKCGHIFHRSCIDRWLKTERECPLCRTCVCVVVKP
ncbi:RING-H2 finger protein ATL66-like [Cucumis melo var. makuwa]|uniref:RING-H2 finger protein ATL66-like n=2 Tax=Cucumis melo TaxID=3656 RepID=A0A5D3BGV5_CUCMM|nr:RING-H2 finger protein ATL66-like [Cucumis melo var. makuwa]